MYTRYGLLLIVAMLAACATVPDPNPALEKARAEYESIQSDPEIVQYAPGELARTEIFLQETHQAWAAKEPAERIGHLAYMTVQQAELARETAKLRAAEDFIARAVVEHAQFQVDARTRQAEEALRQAELAQEEARTARGSLEAIQKSQREAELAAELARVAERERVLRDELNAEPTEGGYVVTLNGLRFRPNQAELQQNDAALDRLAQVLNQYPDRNIRIEGFTDSTGSDELNQKLSEQRAEAVRQALISKGIDASRIEVEGFGKEYPVASNDTASGRQLNRRVEVVILEDAAGTTATGAGP
jgi:outer membrane protein OmpA-like peptidoglycan-associated protein